MNIPFLDLAKEHAPIRAEIEEAVHRVLASGWYILGRELESLESEFAAHIGVKHAIGVGSGTDAIHLALRAGGIVRGDAVACPAHTAAPTVCAILQAEATPVFVDIREDTFCIDPEALDACLARRSDIRTIIPVHLYGHPCEMDRVQAIAARHGATVIEDCAQSHGAMFGGRPCGTLGAAGCFSFYPTKNLGACGDAGMVVTNDSAIADRLRRLRNYGESRKYENAEFGINSRLDEIQAAILRVKLPHLNWWNTVRRELAERYQQGLANTGVRVPIEAAGARHVYHLFVIRHDERDRLRDLLAENGIGTSIHYPMALHQQIAFRALADAGRPFPVAERVCASCLSLPLSPAMTFAEVDQVVAAVQSAMRKLNSGHADAVSATADTQGRNKP